MRLLGWLTRERTVGDRGAPSALDWLLALALAVVALLELESGVFPGPIAIAAAVQVAAILPVAFRRVAPLAAIAASAMVFLPYVVVYGYGYAGGSLANAATELLLVYSVGRHTDGRRLLAGAAFALLMAAEPGIAGRASPEDWAANLLIAGGALGLGVALRIQTERSIALALAAERAQMEQEATARAAVYEERARIASELHDVVAHNVGLIVLQAGGARSVLDTDLGRARRALLAVEETGRQTLDEMRHLVGILRVDGAADRQPLTFREDPSASADRVDSRQAPSILDWLVALALVIIAFIETASGVFPGPVVIAAAVQVAVILPVVFRRVAPLAAIAVTAAIYLPYVVVYGTGNSVADVATLLLLTYSIGRHTEGRRLVAGVAIGVLLLAEILAGAGRLLSPGDWAYLLIVFGGALGIGVALRVQMEQSITLALAVERAQREQEATAQAAVREERARIARELHDVVADKVGLIVLQAGGARSVLATDPGRARTALLQVEETGRQALAEMRHLVGILRVDEGEERQPLPRLERLPALVDETRATGLAVGLEVKGPPVELTAGLDLAAYRLIQEALTNVRKHAAGARAQVRLDYEPDCLCIEVSDDGGPSGAGGDSARGTNGPGHGLIGMRERVQLYDGRMEAGPMAGGGFRVRATLPLPGEAA